MSAHTSVCVCVYERESVRVYVCISMCVLQFRTRVRASVHICESNGNICNKGENNREQVIKISKCYIRCLLYTKQRDTHYFLIKNFVRAIGLKVSLKICNFRAKRFLYVS